MSQRGCKKKGAPPKAPRRINASNYPVFIPARGRLPSWPSGARLRLTAMPEVPEHRPKPPTSETKLQADRYQDEPGFAVVFAHTSAQQDKPEYDDQPKQLNNQHARVREGHKQLHRALELTSRAASNAGCLGPRMSARRPRLCRCFGRIRRFRSHDGVSRVTWTLPPLTAKERVQVVPSGVVVAESVEAAAYSMFPEPTGPAKLLRQARPSE